MLRKGLKQADLARLVGVTPGRVTQWKKGEGEPGADRYPVLAEVLGVTVDWLMGKQLTEDQGDLERWLLEVLVDGGEELVEMAKHLETHEVALALREYLKRASPAE